jgi:hypothetical protein
LVIFIALRDLGKKSSFVDRHSLAMSRVPDRNTSQKMSVGSFSDFDAPYPGSKHQTLPTAAKFHTCHSRLDLESIFILFANLRVPDRNAPQKMGVCIFLARIFVAGP